MTRLVLAVVMLACLAACKQSVLTGGPVDGVVVDAASGQPIPDALVLVKWHGGLETIHSNVFPCYHAELAVTDANGRYHVPAWSMQTEDKSDWVAHVHPLEIPRAVVYKAGYFMPRWTGDEIPAKVEVRRFEGSILERSSYLSHDLEAYQLLCEADVQTAIPIYKAVYEEVRSRAQTPAELNIADSLLVSLETAQFGNDVALDRKRVRRLEHLREHQK